MPAIDNTEESTAVDPGLVAQLAAILAEVPLVQQPAVLKAAAEQARTEAEEQAKTAAKIQELNSQIIQDNQDLANTQNKLQQEQDSLSKLLKNQKEQTLISQGSDAVSITPAVPTAVETTEVVGRSPTAASIPQAYTGNPSTNPTFFQRMKSFFSRKPLDTDIQNTSVEGSNTNQNENKQYDVVEAKDPQSKFSQGLKSFVSNNANYGYNTDVSNVTNTSEEKIKIGENNYDLKTEDDGKKYITVNLNGTSNKLEVFKNSDGNWCNIFKDEKDGTEYYRLLDPKNKLTRKIGGSGPGWQQALRRISHGLKGAGYAIAGGFLATIGVGAAAITVPIGGSIAFAGAIMKVCGDAYSVVAQWAWPQTKREESALSRWGDSLMLAGAEIAVGPIAHGVYAIADGGRIIAEAIVGRELGRDLFPDSFVAAKKVLGKVFLGQKMFDKSGSIDNYVFDHGKKEFHRGETEVLARAGIAEHSAAAYMPKIVASHIASSLQNNDQSANYRDSRAGIDTDKSVANQLGGERSGSAR